MIKLKGAVNLFANDAKGLSRREIMKVALGNTSKTSSNSPVLHGFLSSQALTIEPQEIAQLSRITSVGFLF